MNKQTTKAEIITGYIMSERPFDVCIHTTMGGYLEFCRLESGLMFEENAKMVAERYAETMKKGKRHEDFKGVCVRKGCTIIYEIKL